MTIKTIVVGHLSTNCYLVYDNDSNAAIIDPGDSEEILTAEIKNLGLNIKYIFLTHGHFDHIMAVDSVKKATGAKIIISEEDSDLLADPGRSLAFKVRMSHKSMKADITAKDGDIFTVGDMQFKFLLTPGHTRGSAVILCEKAMFSGDTLFADDCGRCDLPGGDYSMMLGSLKRLSELEGDYDVYPGHDEKTKLSREKVYNINMRQAIEREN